MCAQEVDGVSLSHVFDAVVDAVSVLAVSVLGAQPRPASAGACLACHGAQPSPVSFAPSLGAQEHPQALPQAAFESRPAARAAVASAPPAP